MSTYLLSNKDYTFCNALTWGNCLNHARRAWAASSYKERIFHSAIALIESLPVFSQIASLFEIAIARLFKAPLALTDLSKREIMRIKPQEEHLSHKNRALKPIASPSTFNVHLPAEERIDELDEALFFVHRQIEKSYRDLPWPKQMQNVIVLTEVRGGRGDISAAAKAIALMQKLHPSLMFDWFLKGTNLDKWDLASFLCCEDLSKVHIRYCDYPNSLIEKGPGDTLILAGPVRLQMHISGLTFAFMENAEEVQNLYYAKFLQSKVNKFPQEAEAEKIYPKLHSSLFPSKSTNCEGRLPMGLQPGSGVFLDPSRLQAPLSRGYCCPSYIIQIQDPALRKDLLEAMHVFDEKSLPDYDQYSFNSGYAHNPNSWGKFIDCVAIHEKNKHVVITLNCHGEFSRLSTKQFQDQIFTSKRLAFLKQKGYKEIIFKGIEPKVAFLEKPKDPKQNRQMIVIVRPSFSPHDMRCMSLASERLVATGDNSAVEAWCARCKLYLYEDVGNGGCKWRFLQQQVDLAKTISPTLSKLLALFGNDRRLSNTSSDQHLNEEQKMVEMEALLNNPTLSDETLEFCDLISANYSFDKVFEAAVKRNVWHYYIPELAEVEAEELDEKTFKKGLIAYLRNPETAEKTLHIQNLGNLSNKVEKKVQSFISSHDINAID